MSTDVYTIIQGNHRLGHYARGANYEFCRKEKQFETATDSNKRPSQEEIKECSRKFREITTLK